MVPAALPPGSPAHLAGAHCNRRSQRRTSRGDDMPRKATKATTKRNTTSHLSARPAKGQDVGRNLTSDTIAADIQAFRKQGGRIEVLGNTPLNRVNVTA